MGISQTTMQQSEYLNSKKEIDIFLCNLEGLYSRKKPFFATTCSYKTLLEKVPHDAGMPEYKYWEEISLGAKSEDEALVNLNKALTVYNESPWWKRWLPWSVYRARRMRDAYNIFLVRSIQRKLNEGNIDEVLQQVVSSPVQHRWFMRCIDGVQQLRTLDVSNLVQEREKTMKEGFVKERFKGFVDHCFLLVTSLFEGKVLGNEAYKTSLNSRTVKNKLESYRDGQIMNVIQAPMLASTITGAGGAIIIKKKEERTRQNKESLKEKCNRYIRFVTEYYYKFIRRSEERLRETVSPESVLPEFSPRQNRLARLGKARIIEAAKERIQNRVSGKVTNTLSDDDMLHALQYAGRGYLLEHFASLPSESLNETFAIKFAYLQAYMERQIKEIIPQVTLLVAKLEEWAAQDKEWREECINSFVSHIAQSSSIEKFVENVEAKWKFLKEERSRFLLNIPDEMLDKKAYFDGVRTEYFEKMLVLAKKMSDAEREIFAQKDAHFEEVYECFEEYLINFVDMVSKNLERANILVASKKEFQQDLRNMAFKKLMVGDFWDDPSMSYKVLFLRKKVELFEAYWDSRIETCCKVIHDNRPAESDDTLKEEHKKMLAEDFSYLKRCWTSDKTKDFLLCNILLSINREWYKEISCKVNAEEKQKKGCEAKQIATKIYKSLAMLYHPDKAGTSDAHADFLTVKSLYEKSLEELEGTVTENKSSKTIDEQWSSLFGDLLFKVSQRNIEANFVRFLAKMKAEFDAQKEELNEVRQELKIVRAQTGANQEGLSEVQARVGKQEEKLGVMEAQFDAQQAQLAQLMILLDQSATQRLSSAVDEMKVGQRLNVF